LRFYATWASNDPRAIAELYTDDAVMEDPTLPQPRQGRSEIERYYAEMFGALEDPMHELVDWAMRDSRVWFEWIFGSGGRTVPLERCHGVSIQTLREGLIAHDAAYWVPGG
jgi:hypothetical protein